MELSLKAAKKILILNNSLPETNRKLWVTSSEIQERLIIGGVHRALSLDHVTTALKRCNKENVFLKQRRDRTLFYFRPSEYEDECPDEQRWRDSGLPYRKVAISIMPEQDYFVSNAKTSNHLSVLNQALEDIESKSKSNAKKKKI